MVGYCSEPGLTFVLCCQIVASGEIRRWNAKYECVSRCEILRVAKESAG